MKIVADNFTLSNPKIFENLEKFNEKFFLNFFIEISKQTTFIDLNLGQLHKKSEEKIKFIFSILNSINKEFTVFIDTVKPSLIELCIKYSNFPIVLNSLSYNEEKLKKILPIAKEGKFPVVALIIDRNVPKTLEEKIELAMKIIDKLISNSIDEENIILDPVVVPLGWDNGPEYNKNNLEFLKLKNEVFSEKIKTMMGISNLTTGSMGKNKSVKKVDAYYLSMAYSLGLDYSLINVFNENLIQLLNFIKILEENLIFSPLMFN